MTPLEHYEFLDGPAVRIGIFLSIFNVHINRAPVAARVLELHYKPGEFLNALKPESAMRNESMWIGFEYDRSAAEYRFAVRQISGLIARRIVCMLRARPGCRPGREVWYDQARLADRTDPSRDAVTVTVAVGDKVRAGSHDRRPLEVAMISHP